MSSNTSRAHFERINKNTQSDTPKSSSLAALLEWHAPEFSLLPGSVRGAGWLAFLFVILTAYAVITNNPIMAFTFVLFAMVIFLRMRKQPAIISCAINTSGVRSNNDWYDFENIQSFWILYEPDDRRILLETNGALAPFASIPLGDANPTAIRELLIRFIPEKRSDPGIVDTLARFLHI